MSEDTSQPRPTDEAVVSNVPEAVVEALAAIKGKSTLPLAPEYVMAVLNAFCMKAFKGNDKFEEMSIGVALDSIVATNGKSAILIGVPAGRHVATQRKEVAIEAERASQYGDIFRIDDVPRNLSTSGDELVMPNVEAEIRKQRARMKHLAAINPKAMAKICAVANIAGVNEVDIFMPEGEPGVLFFSWETHPDEKHSNLFETWEGPIKAQGIFVVSKGQYADSEGDEEEDGQEADGTGAATPSERKRGGRKRQGEVLQTEASIVVEKEVVQWADPDAERSRGTWKLPLLNLLGQMDESVAQAGEYEREIASVLRSFNLAGLVVASHTGPTITQYEIEVPPGTAVAKYVKLADDLQVQLGVASVIVNLLPGKKTLGVEIPNKVARIVRLREVCGTLKFIESGADLLVALGIGTDGVAIYADLASTPHLLVGGATNSGKSIGIATILCSLILRNSPETVRLVLIDPKKVEFPLFDGLPHLMCPVVTEMKEVPGVLRAVAREMDKRYDVLKESGCRNIASYNELPGVQRMAFVVVVIDELADMMLQCGDQVEPSIVRLTQLGRAAGIHLVIGTQRPSVDVITGLIKANVPSRISFNVASGVDSKVILDSTGAEKLLGKGDMLYSPIGSQKPMRIQGAFSSEAEIRALCGHWRKQAAPAYVIDLKKKKEKAEETEEASEPDDSTSAAEEIGIKPLSEGQKGGSGRKKGSGKK